MLVTNPFNAMNDFMKNYCFFQLAQLSDATKLNNEQKHQLRDFFFFFYLYTHPVKTKKNSLLFFIRRKGFGSYENQYPSGRLFF